MLILFIVLYKVLSININITINSNHNHNAKERESTMDQITVTPKELLQTLCATIPAKHPVLIKGAPGIGKSDIVDQACKLCNFDLIISHPVVSDPTDYKGLPYADKDGKAHFLPFSDLDTLIHTTRPTVYFLDDLGQAAQSVQAACMQLILARRINGHKVSDQVCFVAATNRKQDRAGVTGILEPVKSRFATILELETDMQQWCLWAIDHNLPVELIAFIRFRPNLLCDFKPSADITNSPCPRTVANVGKLIKLGLPETLEYKVVSGAAGQGFATEFISFLRMFRKMLSPDTVLMNPHAFTVPDDISVLYALCTAITGLVTDSSIDRFFVFVDRIPKEFGALAVNDLIQRKPEMKCTHEFISWVSRNQDMLF